jgi:hypothetical protein
VNEATSDSPLGGRLELAEWVDEMCGRFEAAWQSGGRPRAGDYLSNQ